MPSGSRCTAARRSPDPCCLRRCRCPLPPTKRVPLLRRWARRARMRDGRNGVTRRMAKSIWARRTRAAADEGGDATGGGGGGDSPPVSVQPAATTTAARRTPPHTPRAAPDASDMPPPTTVNRRSNPALSPSSASFADDDAARRTRGRDCLLAPARFCSFHQLAGSSLRRMKS
ncbi:Os01g0601500 [Oryza sativa Japonica Group]|uniref:Os01g0601500 protein n=2 Tax=Oryza sativa subsp. japonica TaxID=39947 RepID=A0A0P0V4W8_ORYSJ|nr:Os01g0601500 [Oryza sativa Japonica Group]